MESLVHHFIYYSENINVNSGEAYTVIEAPKGEYEADDTYKFYRCKIKSAGFSD